MSQWQWFPLSASWVFDIVAPHPNSWVAFAAFMFRLLAYLTFAPVIVTLLMDVTAYVVARTLGWGLDAEPQIHKPKNAPLADASSPSAPPKLELNGTAPTTFATNLRFTSPGEANYELSGLFSPPLSRAGSPAVSRRASASYSAAESDGEGGGVVGIGVKRAFGMTPVDGSRLRAPKTQSSVAGKT